MMSTVMANLAPVEQIYQHPEALREFQEEHKAMKEFFASLEAQLLAGINVPPADAHRPRELELRWLAAHPDVLKERAGQWIALERESLVAADACLSVVVAIAREHGVLRPLIMFIPSNPRDYWLGLSNERIE